MLFIICIYIQQKKKKKRGQWMRVKRNEKSNRSRNDRPSPAPTKTRSVSLIYNVFPVGLGGKRGRKRRNCWKVYKPRCCVWAWIHQWRIKSKRKINQRGGGRWKREGIKVRKSRWRKRKKNHRAHAHKEHQTKIVVACWPVPRFIPNSSIRCALSIRFSTCA